MTKGKESRIDHLVIGHWSLVICHFRCLEASQPETPPYPEGRRGIRDLFSRKSRSRGRSSGKTFLLCTQDPQEAPPRDGVFVPAKPSSPSRTPEGPNMMV